MRIVFTVPAVPVAQPRPRASNRHGFARVHQQVEIHNKVTGERKPHPILAFKATVKHAAALAYSGPPLEGPLMVNVLAEFPRPKPPLSARTGSALLNSIKGVRRTGRDSGQIDLRRLARLSLSEPASLEFQ